jgi:hypothetical protein
LDVQTQLYLNTSKDIQRLAINTKEGLEQDWEVLPYHEESKEKESCNNTRTKSTMANEQRIGTKENLIIFEGKLEGMLDDQILNMKIEVKLGHLIKICPQL